MTAFKSDGAMHLRGQAARKWVRKIKKEKEEQDKARKPDGQSEQNRAANR